MGWRRRAKTPCTRARFSRRACGSATPSPVPVEPNASRFNRAARIASGSSERSVPTLAASFSRRRRLLAAPSPISTSSALSTSLMSMLSRLVGCPQPIADAGLGQDVLWPLGIELDLAPELTHIDAQILRVYSRVPELADEELVGQHLT